MMDAALVPVLLKAHSMLAGTPACLQRHQLCITAVRQPGGLPWLPAVERRPQSDSAGARALPATAAGLGETRGCCSSQLCVGVIGYLMQGRRYVRLVVTVSVLQSGLLHANKHAVSLLQHAGVGDWPSLVDLEDGGIVTFL